MSGRLVRQTGEDTSEVVTDGLNLPIAMELGPDGSMYVATPAIGANDGSGSIVRIALDAPSTEGSPPGTTAGDAPAPCPPIAETISPPAPDASTPPDASTTP